MTDDTTLTTAIQEDPRLENEILESLPAIIREGHLPKGNTLFHRHPAADAIWGLVCMLRAQQKDGLCTYDTITFALTQEWPDLTFSEPTLRAYIKNYVDPCIVPTPDFFRRGVMEQEGRLNHVAEFIKVDLGAENMLNEMKKAVGKPRLNSKGEPLTDEKGRIVMGPTEKDYIRASKWVAEMKVMKGDELARIGMAPERKGASLQLPAVGVNMNFDLRGAMQGAIGASGLATPVDADFKTEP